MRLRDYSLQLNGTASPRLWRVAQGKCGPIVARLSDFSKRSQNTHILMEILQILKCWQKRKKKNPFFIALANICRLNSARGLPVLDTAYVFLF